jgi:hypothetical protein
MKENKEICATCDEICHYIEEEVKPGDIVRLSLGRCYIPGKVVTNNEGIMQIEIESEMIKGLSTIDVGKMKDFLVELEHECPDGMCCTIEAKDD